ncbi:hypothetical protein ABI59_00280 [Acidobacteria bacterium Mor1]|nr:hypothetical protein ABI59_00280 [Acidobacteria bacterium Mor1]
MTEQKRDGITRRHALASLLGAAAVSMLPIGCGRENTGTASGSSAGPGEDPAPTLDPALAQRFAEMEQAVGGRLGACVLDTASGQAVGHRIGERFGMCSTFKVLLAGLVLRAAGEGTLDLERFVAYDEDDLVPYAPVTTENLPNGGMTIGALAEAAQRTSDNVAANLLIRELGGPDAFTALMRELGDSVTRIDRYEPEMNYVPEGEVRDTTSPEAMARSVAGFSVGDWLTGQQQETLVEWMVATRTGRKRIRAGLPEGWRAGDKTGTGVREGIANKYNDVAVVWPPNRAPLVISAYYEAPGCFPNIRDEDQAVLAEAGRIVTWSLRAE